MPRADTDNPLAGRTVLAIFAHPDDESIACGGTLARLSDAGVRVVLLCASHGESGSISDPALVPDGDLGSVRANELRQAARVLGIADVEVLNHPDGDLRWADVQAFHKEIVGAIERFNPDAVITFGDDGLYWHLDHIGVHERTSTAVLSLGAAAPPLYCVTMAPGAMRQVAEAAVAKGRASARSGFWGIEPSAFGEGAKPPTVIVDVREWILRKLAAIRSHRTQMGANNLFATLDETDARRWLGMEHFYRAPIQSSGEPLLEQLNEPAIKS